jgi:hypothetical protein
MNEQIQSRPRGANQHVMWESRERQYCISIKTSYKKKRLKRLRNWIHKPTKIQHYWKLWLRKPIQQFRKSRTKNKQGLFLWSSLIGRLQKYKINLVSSNSFMTKNKHDLQGLFLRSSLIGRLQKYKINLQSHQILSLLKTSMTYRGCFCGLRS